MKKVEIRRFQPADRDAWGELAKGYKAFYKTPTSEAEYNQTWHRLLQHDEIHGYCAVLDGSLAGIVHYLFHTTIWEPRSCYLQDLFTAPELRGQGVAKKLIEAVANDAAATECTRLYWNTQEGNTTARRLYDNVAQYKGFIRYDYPLDIN